MWHSGASVPTHYFIISWIHKQNTGDIVGYIKETNKRTCVYNKKPQPRLLCNDCTSAMAFCRTVSPKYYVIIQ